MVACGLKSSIKQIKTLSACLIFKHNGGFQKCLTNTVPTKPLKCFGLTVGPSWWESGVNPPSAALGQPPKEGKPKPSV